MNLRNMALIVVSCLASQCSVAADSIWKGFDSKGNVVYSNSPKDLKNPQKVVLPEVSISSPDNQGQPALPPSMTPQQSRPPASVSRKDTQAAEDAVASALAAQKSGEEPLPGERLGTAGGGSRLSPAYYARQEALAAAVREAKSLLDAPAR